MRPGAYYKWKVLIHDEPQGYFKLLYKHKSGYRIYSDRGFEKDVPEVVMRMVSLEEVPRLLGIIKVGK